MERYNGWTNYETWNVALWIANDGLADEPARIVREVASDHDQEYETADELADGIIDEVASAIELMCDEAYFSTIPESRPAMPNNWPDNPSPALIRSARMAAGLTLKQAADILELSGHPRWAEYEAGRRNMPPVAWRYWLHMAGLRRLPWHPRHPPIA